MQNCSKLQHTKKENTNWNITLTFVVWMQPITSIILSSVHFTTREVQLFLYQWGDLCILIVLTVFQKHTCYSGKSRSHRCPAPRWPCSSRGFWHHSFWPQWCRWCVPRSSRTSAHTLPADDKRLRGCKREQTVSFPVRRKQNSPEHKDIPVTLWLTGSKMSKLMLVSQTWGLSLTVLVQQLPTFIESSTVSCFCLQS